jgi:hypothetical protein
MSVVSGGIGCGFGISGSLAEMVSESASVTGGRVSVSVDSGPVGVGVEAVVGQGVSVASIAVVAVASVAVVPVVGVGISFGVCRGGEAGDNQKLEHFVV